MVTAERRRRTILNVLMSSTEPVSMNTLAKEADCSARQVWNIVNEFQIITVRGRNGGVKINEEYRRNSKLSKTEQLSFLLKKQDETEDRREKAMYETIIRILFPDQ